MTTGSKCLGGVPEFTDLQQKSQLYDSTRPEKLASTFFILDRFFYLKTLAEVMDFSKIQKSETTTIQAIF